MNNENLKPFTSEQSREEAAKNGAKGGKASGEVRRQKRTLRELAEFLDNLPVTGVNKEKLDSLGVPGDIQTQSTLRLVALQGRAVKGDVRAIRFWYENTGEAPSQKVDVVMDGSVREAYEKAAAAIREKKD